VPYLAIWDAPPLGINIINQQREAGKPKILMNTEAKRNIEEICSIHLCVLDRA
jgi:hypothetical protein